VVIVYLSCVALTSVLAGTPLAVPLTGRPRQTWRSLRPATKTRQLTETEHDGDKRLDPVG
jgi:hypothetical protein